MTDAETMEYDPYEVRGTARSENEEPARPNRATASEAASYVDKYEELEAKIDGLKIEHMNKVRVVRTEMKELLDEAKGQGIAKGTVKAVVKARSLERKAKEALADLDDDQREYGIDIRKALGDDFSSLPLGAAAVEREEGDGAEVDASDPVAKAAQDAWADADTAH